MKKMGWIKNHLSQYKINDLKITKNGIYQGKEYSHILPYDYKNHNFIEAYRNEIMNYINDNNLKLHRDYGHLNSSQVLAFNFIIPFIVEDKVNLLLELLGIPEEEVVSNKLEKVIDPEEGTNFDYFIQLVSGRKIFIEIKYTEAYFGTSKHDINHEDKYNSIYKSKLESYLKAEYNTVGNVLKNYQLMRYLSYLDTSKDDLFILLYPKWSKSLDKSSKRFIGHMLIDSNNVKIIYWEDIVRNAINLNDVKNNDKLLKMILEFNNKYFDLEIPK